MVQEDVQKKSSVTHTSHTLLILLSIVLVALLYGAWYKRTQIKGKIIVDPVESERLLNRKEALDDDYIEVH